MADTSKLTIKVSHERGRYVARLEAETPSGAMNFYGYAASAIGRRRARARFNQERET